MGSAALALVHIEYHRPERSYDLRQTHQHDWNELIVVERGSYRAISSGTALTIGPGEWLSWPAGLPHRPDLSDVHHSRDAYYYLAWRGRSIEPGGQPLTDPQRRLLLSARWLYDVHHRQGAPRSLTAALLRALIEEARWLGAQADGVGDDRLELARHFILEHLGKDLAISHAAEAAGMSMRHFERRFRERYGMTPKAWQVDLRERHALDLLATTNLDLEAIAAAVAMPGAAYLCRRIKNRTGRTPGSFRRSRERQGPGPT